MASADGFGGRLTWGHTHAKQRNEAGCLRPAQDVRGELISIRSDLRVGDHVASRPLLGSCSDSARLGPARLTGRKTASGTTDSPQPIRVPSDTTRADGQARACLHSPRPLRRSGRTATLLLAPLQVSPSARLTVTPSLSQPQSHIRAARPHAAERSSLCLPRLVSDPTIASASDGYRSDGPAFDSQLREDCDGREIQRQIRGQLDSATRAASLMYDNFSLRRKPVGGRSSSGRARQDPCASTSKQSGKRIVCRLAQCKEMIPGLSEAYTRPRRRRGDR